MKIGKYFTVEELTVTSTGIDNTPPNAVIVNLRNLVESIMDPDRENLRIPSKVNSGYRSPQVNITVGGAKTSQHVTGEAADLDCSDNAKLFKLISDNFLFDQLIWEAGDDEEPDWIHISYTERYPLRYEVLKMKDGKYIKLS